MKEFGKTCLITYGIIFGIIGICFLIGYAPIIATIILCGALLFDYIRIRRA